MANPRLLSALTISLWLGNFSLAATAQVTPDGSLGTTITGSPNFVINGGTRPIGAGGVPGPNLFHSFSQFSVPTGGSASFNNAADVVNIFGRVTGGDVSNIDGAIRANGGANLFLINPAGIMFGPNAALNIGGSFIGTTANSVKFADGSEFSATNPAATPLLTISVPIGLQMGANPGAIAVNGTGHRFVASAPNTAPYSTTGAIAGLKVQPQKTLALVGGDIALMGGTLTAERGRIELGSVGQDQFVGLDVRGPIWRLDYTNVNQFRAIYLSQRSLVDVSGAGAGAIQVQGQHLRLTDGSLIFSENRGLQPAGDITIRADLLEIIGGIAALNIRSAIVSETRAGSSGNIFVTARQLDLIDGGSLGSRGFGIGASGNVQVNVNESIQVVGYLTQNPELVSILTTASFSPFPSGRSGNITISSPRLSVRNGGIVTATTVGNAPAGNVEINANHIEVINNAPSSFGSSAITSSSLGQGNAGNIAINTQTLSLQASGAINTTSTNSGAAGNVMVNATQSIEITGSAANRPSNISSNINNVASPELRLLLGLPTRPRGNAGNVTIHTPTLKVSDQGRISVFNSGLGNSGTVSITANQIGLDQQALIGATTAAGEGGNIAIQAQALILRSGSTLTATAGGVGNGGNITINAPVIVGFKDSDIIANAVRGRGGNIQITTQGIFGLKFRPQLTPENDITASSEFGVNGTVQISTLGIDPNSGLVQITTDFTDPSQQISAGCAGDDGSSFVATGRGGIPASPVQELRSDRPWADTRNLSSFHSHAAAPPSQTASAPLIEANAIRRNPDGSFELVAISSAPLLAPFAPCIKAATSAGVQP
jgi:filamentous hemagglutinin family protein